VKLKTQLIIADFVLRRCEMILSRCTYKKNSAAEPWVCPADAKGFLRNHTVSLWAKKYKTKETMRVNWFNGSRGIEFSRLEVRHCYDCVTTWI
jgi:hypothetical protein